MKHRKVYPQRRLLRLPDTALTVGVRLQNAVLQALIIVVLARSTSLADFGSYSIVVSVGIVINALLGTGQAQAVLRSESIESQNLTYSHVITGAIGSIVSAMLLAVSFTIIRSDAALVVVIAGALTVFMDSSALLVQNALFGHHLVRRGVFSIAITRTIASIGVVIGAFAGNIWWYISVFSSVAVLVNASLLIGMKLKAVKIGAAIKVGYNYWRVTVWGMLQQCDVPAVGLLLGSSAAGAYAAGFRLASPVHIVTSSLNSIYVPKLSAESNAATRREIGQRLSVFGVGYSVILMIFSTFTYFLGPWLLGSQFEPFAWLFPIFFVNSALSVVNQISISRLYAESKAKDVANISRISTVIGLCSIFPLAHFGNVYFAAMAPIIIQLILMFGLLLLIRKTPFFDSQAHELPAGVNL